MLRLALTARDVRSAHPWGVSPDLQGGDEGITSGSAVMDNCYFSILWSRIASKTTAEQKKKLYLDDETSPCSNKDHEW